jgi:hypothetical protein
VSSRARRAAEACSHTSGFLSAAPLQPCEYRTTSVTFVNVRFEGDNSSVESTENILERS